MRVVRREALHTVQDCQASTSAWVAHADWKDFGTSGEDLLRHTSTHADSNFTPSSSSHLKQPGWLIDDTHQRQNKLVNQVVCAMFWVRQSCLKRRSTYHHLGVLFLTLEHRRCLLLALHWRWR